MKYLQSYFFMLIILCSVVLAPNGWAITPESKRILMVLSGYGKEKQQAPGYEFDEFAKAYLTFAAHGIAVDIASPQGGKVHPDQYDPKKSFNQQVLNDPVITAKLANTLATADLNAAAYQGIFIVGGKGAMFDLPKDIALQRLIASVYQQQGVVAAVCHGPAALVNVKLADGSYLVANKAVNSFTNVEERLFGKKWLSQFEFMLEDKLSQRGGRFQASPMMLSHVVADQRLITGQNPASTVAVATELIKALGVAPQAMPAYKDDQTLALIAAFLGGDLTAVKTLSANPQLYQLELVAAYGLYYQKSATDHKTLQQSLTMLQIGQVAIKNPALEMAIAQTHYKLGDKVAAKAMLMQLLNKEPEHVAAQEMLKTL